MERHLEYRNIFQSYFSVSQACVYREDAEKKKVVITIINVEFGLAVFKWKHPQLRLPFLHHWIDLIKKGQE